MCRKREERCGRWREDGETREADTRGAQSTRGDSNRSPPRCLSLRSVVSGLAISVKANVYICNNTMTENQSQTLPHKKQKQSNTEDNQLTMAKLYEFQNNPSSLRISASQVSALVGLHPYQNLPQLLFDFVYQSYLGQQLLQIDAKALGLSLVDAKQAEREQMLNLATVASKETKELIQQVLEVSSGKRKLDSVNEVQSIQKKIASNARVAAKAGRMSKKQVEVLVEASRGHVSTGFGTCHEDEALDIYEQRVGCIVRERNEDLMEWRFERIHWKGETDVSAVPMGKAKRRSGWTNHRQEQQAKQRDEETNSGDNSGVKDATTDQHAKQLESSDEKKSDPYHACKSDTNQMSLQPAQSGVATDHSGLNVETKNDSKDIVDLTSDEPPEQLDDVLKRPFFKIVGAVDGIRDEVYMNTTVAIKSDERGEFSDDEVDQMMANYKSPSKTKKGQQKLESTNERSQNDEFSDVCNLILRPIIVECKHRMKKATIPPPLYDQIQTCIYCQMHETEEADLIQVVRNQTAKPDSNADAKEPDAIRNNQHVEITISRISLNDPIHNHKYHWTATLLPRLASFVDAVYTIRKDDTKRYRMLMAMVTYQNEDADAAAEKEAWSLLWNECPWLKHCDTAFGRRR